jgi:hypothetical protein
MLTVIFGAGASYDSAPSYGPGAGIPNADQLNMYHRPPLANELFQDRPMYAQTLERFRECLAIVPQLRHLREGDALESVMQRLQAEAEHYPRRREQLVAVRYYLQWILSQGCSAWRSVIHNVTNYRSLLDQIESARRTNEPVCLITFNYDTLLEDALCDFGLHIKDDLAEYVQGHPFYRVFKLHGSVNWGRILRNKIRSQNPTDPNLVAAEWIRRAAELDVTDEYVLSPGFPTAVIGDRSAFPAIAIPVETGKRFECPSALIDVLRTLLPQTSKLLVIGWRATEEHFLEILKAHLNAANRQSTLRLHVVGASQSDIEGIRHRMYGAIGIRAGDNFTNTLSGFTGFMREDAWQLLRT